MEFILISKFLSYSCKKYFHRLGMKPKYKDSCCIALRGYILMYGNGGMIYKLED